MTTKTHSRKDDRLDLRIKHSQKDFLHYAASLCNMKLSAFVLFSAFKVAEEAVREKTQFFLSPKQWSSFCEALDRPPREIPKLKKLLEGPEVFNE
jgi:uncharacterized protein (DUF1778 family)